MYFGKALAALAGMASIAQAAPVAEANYKRLVARDGSYQNAVYFTNWGIYARNYQPASLPVDKINTVIYAFANINSTGGVYTSDSYADLEKHYDGDSWDNATSNAYGCVKQLYQLKKNNRHLRVLLSIGGWTYSQNGAFDAVKTEEGRTMFAKSAVDLVRNWGFDGIDIDWEYPTEDEADSYVALLKAVRSELDSISSAHDNYHFLLSVATSAGPTHYGAVDMKAVSDVVDYMFFMGYDYMGSFSNNSGHQANLYASTDNAAATDFSTDKAITDYIASGAEAKKIVLGMPIYGRSFESTDGLGKSFSGVGEGTWETGVWDYKDLPKSGATEYSDDQAKGTYSYDSSTKELISYDTPEMIKTKVDYVKQKGLGGSMFWEASADKTDDKSLIGTSYNALGGIDQTQNLLSYPDSQYGNIASGSV